MFCALLNSILIVIDLLDSFGDWIQLALAAVGFWILYPVIAGILKGWNIPQLVGIIGIGFLMWSTVYDYDLIFGFLIGSILGVIGARKNYTLYRLAGDRDRVNLHSGILLGSLLVGVIMLIKIFVFIL